MADTPEMLTPLQGGQLDSRIDLPPPDLSPEAVGVGPTQAKADAIADYEHRRNVRRAQIMGVHYSKQICNGDARFNTGATAAPNEYSRGLTEDPQAWDDRLTKSAYEDIMKMQYTDPAGAALQYGKLYSASQNDPINCNINETKFMGAYEDPNSQTNTHYGAYAGNRAFHWHDLVDPTKTFADRFAAAASDDALPVGEPGGRPSGLEGKVIFTEARPVPESYSAYKVTQGEPVSVTSGEYLETWRDFLVPGDIDLVGSRYMGLKLGFPTRWVNPLGACQLSAFDEFFAPRKFGQLEFFQADGTIVRFNRPFNFLVSQNPSSPSLELKAPELGTLQLKDKKIIKYFREYRDKFYRLEKIEDLNGNALVFHRAPEGLLQRIVGSDGLSLEFANDARGRRTIITLVGTDKSRLVLSNYTYDERGRMTFAECAFGMSVRYEWHETKPLLMRWHNLTRRSETSFTYDEAGRVIHTATSGIWNDDRFRYDNGRRETTYLPGGEEERAQRFVYDERENITAEVDALGGTVSHRYDKAGHRIATTDANGNISSLRYDIRGNIRQSIDAEGRQNTFGWGPHGDLDVEIDGAGGVCKFENDHKGNVLASIDAEKNETRFERDERGRITYTYFPNGSQEKRVYDRHGRLWGVRDGKGAITEFVYDAFGRLIERKAPDGGVTRLSYAAGAGGFATPTSVTRPDGVTISRRFDAEGSLASVTDGEGRSWTYQFGAFEVLQAIVDPKGGRLAFSYDSDGRLTAVGNAVGQIYQLVRDAAGRVVLEEDFDGRQTRYTRDAGGRVIETVKPDGARLVYGYDKTDRVTRIESFAPGANTRAKSQDVTRFWYDARGLLEKAENGSALVEYRRDKNGAVIAEALNGRWVQSKLDAMGRRIERRIGDGLVTYAHAPLGLIEKIAIGDHAPLSLTHDPMGRETRRANGIGFKLDQNYDIAGQLIKQAAGFDGASFGTGLAGAMAMQQAGFAPGASSQIERSYRWDKASSPLDIADKLWGQTAYSYDQNGQVSEARFGDQLTEKFAYDAARNMAGASSSGPQAISGLGEDIGRFVAWKSTPGGVVKTARGPRGERLTLTHDKCGRVIERKVERDGFRVKIWHYEWDAHDRLIRCIPPEREAWRYGYDPFGRRVWKVKEFTEAEARSHIQKFPGLIDAKRLPDRGATLATAQRSRLDTGSREITDKSPLVGTHYLWDGDVLAEEAPLRLDGSVEWAEATRWHYEPGSFRPLAKETPQGDLLYIVTDHLGTPREMMDENGDVRWAASYTTWGLVRGLKIAVPQAANDDYATINWTPGASRDRRTTFGNLALKHVEEHATYTYDCPIRFQGQWQDEETGLYYNRNRHYDPLAGQYISPDPAKLGGGARLHGYVERPANLVDPLGLTAQSELYYRTMSDDDLAALKATNRVPPSSKGETFVSPSMVYSDGYGGNLVEFHLKPGTTKALAEVGLRDDSSVLVKAYPSMPRIAGKKGWMQSNAFFKQETPPGFNWSVTNIGLGKGTALDIFNQSINSFNVVK